MFQVVLHDTQSTQITQKQDEHDIFAIMKTRKQCALPVVTIMALWQLMHACTWCTVTHCWYQWTKECSTSKARSAQSALLRDLRTVCVVVHSWLFGSLVSAICNCTSYAKKQSGGYMIAYIMLILLLWHYIYIYIYIYISMYKCE